MQTQNEFHPLSALTVSYWKEALGVLKSRRNFVVASALIALASVVSAFLCIPIPILGTEQKITVTYLFIGLFSALFGPIYAIPAGFITDTLGYFLHPSGGYMPVFALVMIAKYAIYGLCFFRQKITLVRMAITHLCVTLFCNIFLNSTLIYILYNVSAKAYPVYLLMRVPKNLILYIPEVLLMYFFYRAIDRPLSHIGLLKKGQLCLSVFHKQNSKNKGTLI